MTGIIRIVEYRALIESDYTKTRHKKYKQVQNQMSFYVPKCIREIFGNKVSFYKDINKLIVCDPLIDKGNYNIQKNGRLYISFEESLLGDYEYEFKDRCLTLYKNEN